MAATNHPTARSGSLVPEEDLGPGRHSGTAVDPVPSSAGRATAPAAGATPAAPTPAPAPTATPTPATPEPKPMLPALREIVTAAIGAGIVFVTLALAWRLFSMSMQPPAWTTNMPAGVSPERFDPFQRGKDVLLLLLPLAGAIVGYYTGRVVADRTIDQANQTARTASDAAAQAQTTAVQAQTTAAEAKTETAQAKTEATQARQATQDVKAKAERLAELALRTPRSGPVTRGGGLESIERGATGGGGGPEGAEEVRRLLREIRER